MENFDIYQDISRRTDGDIYIGVVGPVRTGKSTFIKRFMELLVLPNIENEYKKERAVDELPQSAGGKTIMTTEPKFVPNEAIEITLDGNIKLKTRLVDCVGYLVKNSLGHMEDDMPRMVKTPWAEEEMPFETAAEIGTKKVITEHSSVGMVITTDGSITGIPREDYVSAEERVVNELKELNKPFVMVLNSNSPYTEECKVLAKEMEEKYQTQVIPMSCLDMTLDDLNNIFTKLLYEFVVERINIRLPKWVNGLSLDNSLKMDLFSKIKSTFKDVKKIVEVQEKYQELLEDSNIKKVSISKIDLGSGEVCVDIELQDSLFYDILTSVTGVEIKDEEELFSTITNFAKIKKEYDKMAYAIHEVYERGYGIVNPGIDDLILEEPEIVKQGQKYGVKLRAKAPSIHMLKIETETEVSPIVGSERQSEDLVKYLLSEFENDPKKIWESNIFGKSLHDLVNEGLQNKLARMPESAQDKLRETIQRIVNEGGGGLICIIL
ncbi:MAG: stage IV sporulation protein A [Clostridia bacterium]|nr:stage IV sporulation protein A [Clostridia bacterium]